MARISIDNDQDFAQAEQTFYALNNAIQETPGWLNDALGLTEALERLDTAISDYSDARDAAEDAL